MTMKTLSFAKCNTIRILVQGFFFVVFLGFLAVPAAPAVQITEIHVTEDSSAINVRITGDGPLIYTSVKQSTPLGLALFFTDAELNIPENVFTPRNEIIQAVSATVTGASARVRVLLKKDAYYEINRVMNGLELRFSRTAAAPVSATRTMTPAGASGGGAAVPASAVNLGTRLQSVYAARYGDSLKVFVGADGTITNYRSFIIESPARIVFDIFSIQSPYRNEKIVPVKTKWVNQIRYYSYPDRVRVILDTQKAYLHKFAAHPVENGLLIQMGEDLSNRNARILSVEKPAASGVSGGVPGNRISSVYASQLDDGILVTVRGNGVLNNFSTSVTQDPAEIIVDLPGVDSPYVREQVFPVDTQWVKQVRHQKIGDRVQVRIETRRPYLSSFEALPDKDGMVVKIMGPGIPSTGTPRPVTASAPSPAVPDQAVIDETYPAAVTAIEFSKEDAGKSTLSVEATRAVRYEMAESGDRALALRLYNTRIAPQYRRPLITDRFESAVDEIRPGIETGSALFQIHLRESVPYFVERSGNRLLVHFEASSISPRPVTAGLTTVVSGEPAGAPESPSAALLPPADLPAAAPAMPAASPDLPSMPADLPLAAGSPALPLPDAGIVEEPDPFEEKPPEYTGEKIALDFFETDIKNVFRILREVSGMNFAIDKDVTGKVTLTLAEPVPWDQVLDLILKMNKLGKFHEGNIIRIATRTTLEEEAKAREERKTAALSAKDKQKQLEPVYTEYLAVNYSNATEEIQPHIEKMLTRERGSVSVDERTNMVIITDTREVIRRAKELIRKLDRVTPQVMIEARVVEATTSFQREIGTQWEMGLGVQPIATEAKDGSATSTEAIIGSASDETAAAVNKRVGVGPSRGYDVLGGTYGYNMGMNFPVSAEQTGSIGFNFTRIAGTPLLLNAKLSAMESLGEVKIVSAPKVLTLDNKKATIKQGLDYPYQTVEDGEVKVEFKQVDLLLEVTPHVTPDNRISMILNITKNDLGQVISSQQSFNTKEAKTELLINDGDTVVIGGIIKTRESESYTGIPGLSKIPLLGWLFKSEGRSKDKEELLIFLTPKIVKLEQRQAEY